MSAVAICTDSSALFPDGAAELLGVIVVPIAITLDGEPFEERDATIDDFYARLSAGAPVTTSQPSPGAFLEAYEATAARGSTAVLSIHLDARISGTVASAELAAREAPIPITVVDAKTASFGVGLCVRAAAAALAAGASVSTAAETVRKLGGTLRNVFVAPAGPPGRLPETPGWALLELTDGKVESIGACEGDAEAIEVMSALVRREGGPLRVAVGHAGASSKAAAGALAASLAGLADVVEVERYRVGAAVGAHTGANSFGAFWWPA
jgi:fatty acid-binding protein DegV